MLDRLTRMKRQNWSPQHDFSLVHTCFFVGFILCYEQLPTFDLSVFGKFKSVKGTYSFLYILSSLFSNFYYSKVGYDIFITI
jgi:hypothetical protein